MATLQDVRDAAELRLGDTGNAIWAEAELTIYVKEGQADLVRRTGCLWVRDQPAGLIPTASTGTYTLPTNLIQLERITYQNIKMYPLTHRQAAMRDPLYRTTEGVPRFYLLETDGIGTIRYVSVPADTGAATDITVEYQKRAATLATDGTSLDIPDRYADYVRHFVMWKAYERDGPGQNLKMANHYLARYEEGIARMLKRRTQAHAARITRLGGGTSKEPLGRPRLPWQYGSRVR
jgi:hypothetical protein